MNRPTWFEIPAVHPEKLADFYAAIFGWKKQKWEGPHEYWMILTGPQNKPGMNGGIMPKGELKCPINTIEVDKVDVYAKKVVDAGGKITKQKQHNEGVGNFIWCEDCDDNPFVIMEWQEGITIGEMGESNPGATIYEIMMNRPIHFEIPGNDPEKLAIFYEKVFGWKKQKWGEGMDYWLMNTGENDEPGIHGAIMKKGDIQCTVNTINIDNIDKYLEKVVAKGGKILMPKDHIETVGWFSYCLDPEGNQFGLMQPDPDMMMM
jgi:uncharacterized protein